nr:methyl-accepting chemotaxis protein [Solidesulfovibrio sp.]
MKLSVKLPVSFSTIVLIFIAYGVASMVQLKIVYRSTNELAVNWLPSIKEVGTLTMEFANARRYELNYLTSLTDDMRRQNEQRMVEALDKVKQTQIRYDKLISSDKERRSYETFTENASRYYQLHDKIFELIGQQKKDEALAISSNDVPKVFNSALDALQQCVAINDKGGIDEAAAGRATYEQAWLFSIVLLSVAVVIGVFLSIYIPRSILPALLQGKDFASKLAVGDLTGILEIKTKDELGELADSLRSVAEAEKSVAVMAEKLASGDLRLDVRMRSEKDGLMRALRDMVGRLTDIVQEVQAGAENMSSGAEELSASSQALSQGASEQASAVEESSASMEEMSSAIKQNADNAQQTESLARKAAEDAKESGTAMNQTVAAMREISSKISVIEEIARQTDLLALNAAVEAARAGEHGRGFAVVAAEVRKLAERSQAAAAEINALSSSSLEVAERAGGLLGKLVPDIHKTSELVQEIAASSAEQSAGASQVNRALQQLDQVVQQNASSSEEVASTAEELSSQAEQLQATIGFFQVAGSSSRTKALTQAPLQARKAAARAGKPKAIARTAAPAALVDLGPEPRDDDFERF